MRERWWYARARSDLRRDARRTRRSVDEDVARGFPRGFVFAESSPFDEELFASAALAAREDAFEFVDVVAEIGERG